MNFFLLLSGMQQTSACKHIDLIQKMYTTDTYQTVVKKKLLPSDLIQKDAYISVYHHYIQFR